MDLLKVFSNIYKGEAGEAEVLSAITKLLNGSHSNDENYFLIPKATIKDINGSREVDLLLLHPVFGIYAIEVKNWKTLDSINSKNDPFKQANNYQDILLSILKRRFGQIPINIEYRIIFPEISIQEAKSYFEKNPYYKNYENHIFFKEHLEKKDIFKRFFNASNGVIPNKKRFLEIASMLVPTDRFNKNQKKIIPVITKDEILFFDQKQLSILNGYTGGFRIVRGVAGTGKTVILTNFVTNKLKEDNSEKFLILCFNRNLVEMTKESFGDSFQRKNVAVLTLMEMLDRIGFDYNKAGISKNATLDNKYKAFESDLALKEFRLKFHQRLQKKPIDYFLCDETQDMPAGFMRIIYEEIHDCIFFIDEAQRFYPYTMQNISEVFHHPKFEKISMRGRVKNLKNVYRTPSNIAKSAFEILSMDRTLNNYYKRSFYLKEGFIQDINLVLEDGEIRMGDWDDFIALESLLLRLPRDQESVILTYTKKDKQKIEEIIQKNGWQDRMRAMTLQSVKGLESQNIVIHKFGKFIEHNIKHKDIVFRQLYVILTRAQERVFLSVDRDLLNNNNFDLQNIIQICKKYERKTNINKNKFTTKSDEKKHHHKLAKLTPSLHQAKEGAELIVAASELFALIGGLFSMAA